MTSSEMDGSGNCCPYVRPKISFPSRSSFFYGRSVHVKATFFFSLALYPISPEQFCPKTNNTEKKTFDGCSGRVYDTPTLTSTPMVFVSILAEAAKVCRDAGVEKFPP